jgi:hypothetical protein
MGADMLAKGRIDCDAGKQQVVITSVFLPTVTGVSLSDGAVLWTDSLRPFRPIEITDMGGKFSIGAGKDGYSRVTNVATIGNTMVFQASYDDRRDQASDTTTSYIFSQRERMLIESRYDWPLFIAFDSGFGIAVTQVDLDLVLELYKIGA